MTPLASALRGIDRLHTWESLAIPAAEETLAACKRGCRRKLADLRCNDCHAARLEIRADIKAAKRSGEIADGVKVSVRYDSFAGGSAIRVKVTEVPAGFEIHNREHVAFTTRNPHDIPPRDLRRYTPEAYELLERLSGIALAYNRDDSDSMTDYFNTNFYDGRADFDWQLEAAAKSAIEIDGRTSEADLEAFYAVHPAD